jgi:ferredoxin
VKVKVDREACIGDETCVTIASDIFEMDDEGIAVVLQPNPADEDLAREAAESCPVDAIILEDDEGNQLYP